MDNQEDMTKKCKLIELFIDGLSKTSTENQHLLVTAFLTVKRDDENLMMAFVAPVKSKFKELIICKKGKYSKGLFKTTLLEMCYTSAGREAYNQMNNIIEDVRSGITRYTYSSIFCCQIDWTKLTIYMLLMLMIVTQLAL